MATQNEKNKGLNASQAGTVTLGDAPINRMAFGTMRLTGPEQLHLVHFRYTGHAGVPFADYLGAMIELQQEGKVRHNRYHKRLGRLS